MRKYQLTLVTKSTDPVRKKAIDSVKEMLKGSKLQEEEIGEKELAYPIKRENKGFYTSFLLDTEALPTGFEKKLNADDNILRYLIIKL
ncbi:MAG: 30S ribosomal protein S6 [Candidatus Levybacteria bacterium RIFCSPHIGHO2_01_FULL_37_17]|nr:MAG: 30S ribosomal protein S6 [Candidatus Levybacteria bacterium RIFCSPHIGHO2_01_FULL_37_17]OGH36850.1 MAG: 30S ribosomal protein S6 [Candidatus Levybacteria bacterium RIFCSPLOWO2_01_FULL_38_23]